MNSSGVRPPPPSGSGGTEIERIRAAVAYYFPVYETRITPQSLVLHVHVDPATLESKFDALRRQLWDLYYIPQIRRERGEHLVEVVRRPVQRGWGTVVNAILLGVTILTTVLAGGFIWQAYVGQPSLSIGDLGWGGLTFALPLLLILGLHELAHYLTARHHHVEASLPYFIPVPPPFLIFGTFGAFISLREPIPNKKALLDIGASGPLAGFAVAIPVTILGMFLSAHAPSLSLTNCGPSFLGVPYGNFLVGSSLFWYALAQFVPVAFVNLHPLALAGWVGLLVTAINLLPAGQLDGGHVFRALLGDRSRWVSYAAVGLLFVLGVYAYPGWLIFAFLILFLGMRHPPPLNDITPLDLKRWGIGLFAAAVLVTGFVLVPLASPTGQFDLSGQSATPIAGAPGLEENLTLRVNNHDLVDHAYLLSATILTVYTSVNGPPLNASALADFEANTTWTVYLPNGNVSTNVGGSFALPPGGYFSVPATGSSPLVTTFSNPQAAIVTVELTVNEICSYASGPDQSADFTIP